MSLSDRPTKRPEPLCNTVTFVRCSFYHLKTSLPPRLHPSEMILDNKDMAEIDAAAIARLSLHNPHDFSVQHSQTLHRFALVQEWKISNGSKVVEIGCGQGDCTTVIASAVGEEGSVVAIDPADSSYGMNFRFLLPCVSVQRKKHKLIYSRCPIYSRRCAEPYFKRPIGKANYLGTTIATGVSLITEFSLPTFGK